MQVRIAIQVGKDNRHKVMEALVELIIRIITRQELSILAKEAKSLKTISILALLQLVMLEVTPQPRAEEAINLTRATLIVVPHPQASTLAQATLICSKTTFKLLKTQRIQ